MSLLTGKSGERYITVLHAPYPGYRVRIPCVDQDGEVLIKDFKGYQKSLDHYWKQAVAWRDAVYKSLYGKPIPIRILHDKSSAGTGISGVRRVEKIVRKQLKSGELRIYRIHCIIAEVHLISGCNYQRPRGSKSHIFSIAKFGEEEALRLATSWRKEMQASIRQGDYNDAWCLAGPTAPLHSARATRSVASPKRCITVDSGDLKHQVQHPSCKVR